MLTIDRGAYLVLLGHCHDGLPLEACGLLGGDPATNRVHVTYPTANEAASARVYTIPPKEHLRADRDAEGRGMSIVGVFHSHTHTDPYPSPTDVAQAPDPTWHYVIVSLRDDAPMLRSYLIVGGQVEEEPVVLA